jgi:hypothetical protein
MLPGRGVALPGVPPLVGGLLLRELPPLQFLVDGFALTLAARELVVIRIDVDFPAHVRSRDGAAFWESIRYRSDAATPPTFASNAGFSMMRMRDDVFPAQVTS